MCPGQFYDVDIKGQCRLPGPIYHRASHSRRSLKAKGTRTKLQHTHTHTHTHTGAAKTKDERPEEDQALKKKWPALRFALRLFIDSFFFDFVFFVSFVSLRFLGLLSRATVRPVRV